MYIKDQGLTYSRQLLIEFSIYPSKNSALASFVSLGHHFQNYHLVSERNYIDNGSSRKGNYRHPFERENGISRF